MMAGGTLGIALAGCLSDDDRWELEAAIPVNAATLYREPDCNCCIAYAEYLEDTIEGSVHIVVTDELSSMKSDHDIDPQLWSCHTVEFDEYVVEGHVPASVLERLVDEQPPIHGVALPGMPAGSPGMGGEKAGTWTIYEFRAGEDPAEYMTM